MNVQAVHCPFASPRTLKKIYYIETKARISSKLCMKQAPRALFQVGIFWPEPYSFGSEAEQCRSKIGTKRVLLWDRCTNIEKTKFTWHGCIIQMCDFCKIEISYVPELEFWPSSIWCTRGEALNVFSPASDWLITFWASPLNGIWQNLTGGKSTTSSTKFVVFGGRSETKMAARPLIGWDILDFSFETAERNFTKLDRKQEHNVIYQVCGFFFFNLSAFVPFQIEELRCTICGTLGLLFVCLLLCCCCCCCFFERLLFPTGYARPW